MTMRHDQVKDPAAIWRNALTTFVSASVEALTAWLHTEYAQTTARADANAERAIVADASALREAAELLGVDSLASVDEIRSAFRARVKAEVRSGGFHDQAGDVTDARAQELIAAKNLLIEHATALEVRNG